MRPRLTTAVVIVALIAVSAACTGENRSSLTADRHEEAHDLEVVAGSAETVDVVDAVTGTPTRSESVAPPTAATEGTVAMIGEHGHLGSLTDPSVDDVWLKWRARPSLDGTTAVMTLHEGIAGTLGVTRVSWVSLPDATETDRLTIGDGPDELNAVSQDGDLIALTNFAPPARPGEIAGAKPSTTLRIADRDGIRYEAELDGNFVAEAFGRSLDTDGLPEQVFLLEHLPADAPRFYRVRVLSTATGEVSLPLNLRDKSQSVDERMSGLSRSQVIADEHGLLFTLYRGTVDGSPDGEPYAFVHTLDLADGVWCLFLDPALELETYPGSIAVGGDRLYVASANGVVGSISIPSISDVNRVPETEWVVDVGPAGDEPPVLLADDDGAWVGVRDGERRLIRLGGDGRIEEPLHLEDANPTALAFDAAGDVVAAGDGWSTVGDFAVPDWFGTPSAVFTGR